jgi:hypothetical protein
LTWLMNAPGMLRTYVGVEQASGLAPRALRRSAASCSSPAASGTLIVEPGQAIHRSYAP